MIYGVGLDIIEVSRIKKTIQKDSFVKKVFSDDEILLFESRSFNAQVVSGNFAAKEATLKALGKGISSGFLRQIEVLRSENGKPYINLLGDAEKYAKSIGSLKFFVSISHLKDIACANVVIEKTDI